MRKTTAALISLALAATILPASAQSMRRDRDRDADNARTATATELAAADRRLNQVYQRRIADARADDQGGNRRGDRGDRRFRGWYSQEQALRDSERLWINFRDAECRYLTQQDLGRRDRAAYVRGCLLNQTNERIADLRDAEVMLSER